MAQNAKDACGHKSDDLATPTSLEMVIRTRARTWIETIIEDEREDALPATPSARVQARRGYGCARS